MALFGRDSLLTAWMALGLDPRLALNTLRTLARLQGTRVDPLTEEEPGRILHEVGLGREAALALGGGTTYYGTADATPLFVMLLAELDRWGALPDADRPSLLAAADRATAWILEYGDVDSDGFVEYRRRTDRGLVNQGWKDSFDGINHADGHLATPPIALCEVQGYVYAAFQARAFLAEGDGDTVGAQPSGVVEQGGLKRRSTWHSGCLSSGHSRWRSTVPNIKSTPSRRTSGIVCGLALSTTRRPPLWQHISLAPS